MVKLKAAVFVALSLVLAAGLSACAEESTSAGAKESSQQFASGDSKFDETVAPEKFDGQAVISVAGVDVDGLNATAAGYATQVIEQGLQCEFIFAKGEAKVERSSVSVADRSGSSCGVVTVPTTELERGTWEVTLLITGADQDIAPDSLTMEVP